MSDLCCQDCGMNYLDFGLDMLFPNGQWQLITPDGVNILCPNCMVERAASLPGAAVVHAVIEICHPENEGCTSYDYRILRILRRAAGMTLREAFEKSGISISFLSDIERGRTNPSVNTLERLAEIYNVDTRIFFRKEALGV